jgi:hypothetical protein
MSDLNDIARPDPPQRMLTSFLPRVGRAACLWHFPPPARPPRSATRGGRLPSAGGRAIMEMHSGRYPCPCVPALARAATRGKGFLCA